MEGLARCALARTDQGGPEDCQPALRVLPAQAINARITMLEPSHIAAIAATPIQAAPQLISGPVAHGQSRGQPKHAGDLDREPKADRDGGDLSKDGHWLRSKDGHCIRPACGESSLHCDCIVSGAVEFG